LMTQPANSPDLNVNDLGFFNALQASCCCCCCCCPRNAIELITMVTETFNECPMNKSNHFWLTCQSTLNKAIKNAGYNQHKIPHMGKDKLEREGCLRAVVSADPELPHSAWMLENWFPTRLSDLTLHCLLTRFQSCCEPFSCQTILHCAKSCRPFELFANENHKLWHLREVQLEILGAVLSLLS